MSNSLNWRVTVETPIHAPCAARFWFQARGAVVPHRRRAVLTMQLLEASGVHLYHGLASLWTEDRGLHWTTPEPQPSLAPRRLDSDLTEVPIDATPFAHRATGKLLLTGATVVLSERLRRHVPGGRSSTFYAVYDEPADTWSEWATLRMPEDPEFAYARAGCTQAVELPGGDILLPIYFGGHDNDANHQATVVRCRFDGLRLSYLNHGNVLRLPIRRGLGEPSLTAWCGNYYLTLRSDESAYVARSPDGLAFEHFEEWKFDDGAPLGSYNTQQHWIAHSGGLFLAYTRRGADNDEVFRHRAPLFLARIDPERLRVLRATETILFPKVGSSEFGNFGVFHLDPHETWATAGRGDAKPGEPNVYIARINWSEPNLVA